MAISCYLLCLVIFSVDGESTNNNMLSKASAPIYSTRNNIPEKGSTAGRPQVLIDPSRDDNSNCSSPLTCCEDIGCNCNELLPHDVLACSENANLSVLYCVCVTFEEESIDVGQCLYSCRANTNSDTQYHEIPTNMIDKNEFICGDFNRNGTLCGECKDGYYPLVNSFDMHCVQCPNGKANWWKFALAAFLPLTIFYFIILFFKVNLSSSRLHGFVFFSQCISIPAATRVLLVSTMNAPKIQTSVRYLVSFYGIWNLDFFRSLKLHICLGTDTLQTLALDLIAGVYPLLLMVLTYLLIELHDRNFRPLVIIWRPFGLVFSIFSSNWEIRTSLIDAFATFFLLANVKFLSVSFDLLVPVKVYNLDYTGKYNHSLYLYYDATIPYFGNRHLPYAILAISVFVIFVLLPVVLLLLYPFRWFQKFLNLFPIRWYILHTFVDTFQGIYKDGTEPGTRDCRWFASILFVFRFILMLVSGCTLNATYFPIAAVVLILVAILYMEVQPYKTDMRSFTDINVTFMVLLALWYAALIGVSQSIMKSPQTFILYGLISVISGTLPLLYISVIILHWIYSHRKFHSEIIQRFHAWRHGYELLE